jgi:uncharacterized protein YegP (UPF0339 family)
MAASNLKFVIFRDRNDGYRWRLSSASGETLEYSERGHDDKSDCEQDVYRLKDDRYPYARVRDHLVNSKWSSSGRTRSTCRVVILRREICDGCATDTNS